MLWVTHVFCLVLVFCLGTPALAQTAKDLIAPRPDAFAKKAADLPERVSKEVDLSTTITKYAEAKGLSVRQARLETLLFLGLAYRVAGLHQGDVEFQKISTDLLNITADKSYFERLPAMLKCLELGKKQIVVHVQTLEIDPQESDAIHRFLTPGTVKVYYDSIPAATHVATSEDGTDDFEPYIATSTAIHQNVPVTIGSMSEARFAKLKHYVRTSPTAFLKSSGSLAALPGQAAALDQLSQQPFIVGTSATAAFGKTVRSPTIQTLENGTSVRVKALPNGDKIQLMTDIAIARIAEIDHFRGPGPDGAQIQMPAQQLRQVHMAANVTPGATILVDPNFVQTVSAPQGKKKNRKLQKKLLVTLRAELVSMDKSEEVVAAK